jgi:hypothetical protein
MGRCSQFIAAQFGFSCETRESDVPLVIAAPVQVLQNNPNRVAWTIFNLGANPAYLSFGGTIPSATHGIEVAAGGGFISVNAREEGELPARDLYGISTGGATALYVSETVANQ